MTVALVVGVGEVGTAPRASSSTRRASRRSCSPTATRRARGSVADALGPSVHAIEYAPGDAIPPDVAVIACALPAGVGHDVVAAAIAAGVPVASSDDEHDAIEQLRALDHERPLVGGDRRDRLRARARALRRARGARGGVVRECRRDSRRAYRLGRPRERRHGAPRAPGSRARVARRRLARGALTRRRARCSSPSRSAAATAGSSPARPGCSSTRSRTCPGSRCSSASRPGARASAAGSATKASGVRRASKCGASGTARTAASPTAWSTAPRSPPARCSRSWPPAWPERSVRSSSSRACRVSACSLEPVPFLAELAQRGVRAAVFEGVPVA